MTAEDTDDYVDLTPYKAARREIDDDPRPPGFRLFGELYVSDLPVLPAAALLDLQVRSREQSRTEGLYAFLGDVLDGDSWKRFEVAFRNQQPDTLIDLDVLDECVGQVLTEFTARPTREPASSPSSSSGTGPSGKPGSTKKAARSR